MIITSGMKFHRKGGPRTGRTDKGTRQRSIHHHQWMFTASNWNNVYCVLNHWCICINLSCPSSPPPSPPQSAVVHSYINIMYYYSATLITFNIQPWCSMLFKRTIVKCALCIIIITVIVIIIVIVIDRRWKINESHIL